MQNNNRELLPKYSNYTCKPKTPIKANVEYPIKIDSNFILANELSSSSDVTVVTAYFDIGMFLKSNPPVVYTPNHYKRWMRKFKDITNPTIGFFTSKSDSDYFVRLRAANNLLNRTLIVLINETQLWTYQWLRPRIAHIFSDKNYPRYQPNTVNADYACLMHAKYELMLNAIQNNSFRTKYFSWVDIGLYRSYKNQKERFSISVPVNFDENSIAYTEVTRRNPHLTSRDIFLGNKVWLCGCFFIGRASVMARWSMEYLSHLILFTFQGLANTDQQVIYAMINCYLPAARLQTYINTDVNTDWFYLGYLSRNFTST